jgi:predicted amidophosphoribosyltransferase
LIRKAADLVLRERESRLFRDYTGAGALLWSHDLLAKVRGWDGQAASVPAATIMAEVSRQHIEDVYALGIYTPWHQGIKPLFTQYIKELKKDGQTVGLASALLWQGLTGDVDSGAPGWIEKIDVVVPMATSLGSYRERGCEVTEQLAEGLAARLCVPFVDAFERDPDATATHRLSGYESRVAALKEEMVLKAGDIADLAEAEGVLIVDDIVTYGSTFEACASVIQTRHAGVQCWGAALAYTQTEARLNKALREREE